jgi:hypothetical protein
MYKSSLFLAGFLLVLVMVPGSAAFAQTGDISPFAPLRNKNVLQLVDRKVTPEAIVKIIKSSWCNFDTFPPVLQDLKERGVAAQVLEAMVEAPYGPPANSRRSGEEEQPIYHSAEQLKQLGFLSLTPLRREDQGGGFSADRGRPSIMRR